MSNPKPVFQCPRCEGKGHIDMSDALLETWQDLRDNGESTAGQIFDRMAPGPLITALYNRLDELMEYRLVKRRKVGRNWVFSLITEQERAEQIPDKTAAARSAETDHK